MWRVFLQSHPRFGQGYEWYARSPRWVRRSALGAAVLVVVVPLVLLTLAALLVGFVVAVLLGTIALAGWFIRRMANNLFGLAHGGRRNVRVIQRL